MQDKILSLFDSALAGRSQKGIDQMLLSGYVSNKRGVSLFEEKIDSVEIADEIKIGVWLCVKERWGCATLEQVSEDALKRAIEQAILATEFSDADPDYSLAIPLESTGRHEPDASLPAYTMSDFEDIARSMEQRAKGLSPLIKNIPRIGCGFSIQAHVVVNSEGVRFVQCNHLLKAGLSVMAAGNDDRMVNSYEIKYFKDRKSFDPDGTVDAVANEAISRVSPRTVTSGSWPVIFDPRVASQLLATFSNCFSGDFLYRKIARLEGRLRQKIASEIISVRETALGGLMPHTYDAEGTPCQDKQILHKGIFETFLHNRYTGKKAGVETTGNASGAVGEAPEVAPTNMFWEAQGVPAQDLYKEISRGILVKELHGASASPISGDFSYGAIGYWIENGEIAYPIADFTIAGNFFDLLQNIIGAGDDLCFYSPHVSGSYGGRSLLVRALAVSGK
jgi:PmbA protein